VIEGGFSGAGAWTDAFDDAVIALVAQSRQGDGRAVTIDVAAELFPEVAELITST